MHDLAPGRVLGPAVLERFIGEGQVGTVWLARHRSLDIPVAVKVLREERLRPDSRYHERFKREARLAASLDHPGIVRVLDFGDEEGIAYMVMEYVDGASLDQHIKRRKQPFTDTTVLRILVSVSQALAAAHAQGVVHRDLKPANLLLSSKGFLKIADLGLARVEGGASLTQERMVVGSPAYLAPECFQEGVVADQLSDVYSLGVICYCLAYGRLPYDGTISDVMRGHVSGTADFTLPTACTARTIALVRRMMAVERSLRPAGAAAIANEVRQMLQGHDTTRVGNKTVPGSSSDLANLTKYLASSSSEVDGRTIVHTTKRERRLVWAILAGVIGLVVAAMIAYGGNAQTASSHLSGTPSTQTKPPAAGTPTSAQVPAVPAAAAPMAPAVPVPIAPPPPTVPPEAVVVPEPAPVEPPAAPAPPTAPTPPTAPAPVVAPAPPAQAATVQPGDPQP